MSDLRPGTGPAPRSDGERSLHQFREWRCVCAAWNPMNRASCKCGKFWQRSEFGGRLAVR